jgi:hypothetical protein
MNSAAGVNRIPQARRIGADIGSRNAREMIEAVFLSGTPA